MTDWGTTSADGDDSRKYKASTCAGCIRAGNDLVMPGSKEDFVHLYDALKQGEVSPAEIRRSARRMLKMIMRMSMP